MNSSIDMITTRSHVPRRISCGSGLDRIDPPLFVSRPHLVDYSTFRASLKESTHGDQQEKKLGVAKVQPQPISSVYKTRGHGHGRRRSSSSALNMIPPASRAPAAPAAATPKDHANDDNDDKMMEDESTESEVVFTMKITKPSRLYRRRRTSMFHTSTTTNTVSDAGSTTLDFPNRPTKQGSSFSLWDDNMTLPSMSVFVIDDDVAEVSGPMAMASNVTTTNNKDDMNMKALVVIDMPGADFGSQAHAGGDDYTCNAVANHDSFQTNAIHGMSSTDFGANERPMVLQPQAPVVMDLRKKRKSMMNWLANQISSRNLLQPPPNNMDDIHPPTFVKVMYLPEDRVTTTKY